MFKKIKNAGAELFTKKPDPNKDPSASDQQMLPLNITDYQGGSRSGGGASDGISPVKILPESEPRYQQQPMIQYSNAVGLTSGAGGQVGGSGGGQVNIAGGGGAQGYGFAVMSGGSGNNINSGNGLNGGGIDTGMTPLRDPSQLTAMEIKYDDNNNGQDFAAANANKKKSFLSRAGDKVRGIKVDASLKMKELKNEIKNNEYYQKGNEAYKQLANEIKANMNTIKDEIKESVTANIKEFIDAQKEKINKWIRLKIEKAVIKLLDKVRPHVKEALKDPYMWDCVKDIIDDLVDEIWPEIQEEALYQISLKLDEPYVYEAPPRNVFCCFRPICWIRAWYLYATNPVDMNFWQQTRTFSWWFLLIVSAIPYYGVQSYFFLIVFLMIDKSDEYQLVNFILGFKRMQFLTGGVIQGIIGYLLYFNCATLHDFQANPQDYLDCTKKGAGASIDTYADIIAFFLQLVMIWIAFLLLPCSRPKGKPKLRYALPDTNKASRCCCCMFDIERGGRLKIFMVYDLITFLFAVGIFFLCEYVGKAKQEWQLKGTYYFAKIVYGLLSFPWIVFVLPFAPTLLTKSRETAYDKNGNCVPILKVSKLKADEEKEELLGRKGAGIEELFN